MPASNSELSAFKPQVTQAAAQAVQMSSWSRISTQPGQRLWQQQAQDLNEAQQESSSWSLSAAC